MFPSNLEYKNDNISQNDNEDLNEMCACVQAMQKLVTQTPVIPNLVTSDLS